MNAKLLATLIGAIGLVVAVIVGSTIGESTYLPIGIGLGVLLFWCFFAFYGPGATIEAKLLATLIFGYTTFQRMFADIHFRQWLYIGELGLAAIFVLVLSRIAFRKGTVVPPISLTVPIMALLVFGGLRFLLVDVGEYGFLAARDFATVYYMLFYFIGYTVGQNSTSAQLVKRTFRYGVVFYIILISILRVIAKGGALFKAWMLLGTRDMAVIVPAVGCLLCVLYSTYPKRRLWLLAIGVVPLMLLLLNLERSSYLAFAAALLVLTYAQSTNMTIFAAKLATGAMLVAISIIGISVYSQVTHDHVLDPIVEKATHIFDIDAIRSSKTATAGSTDTSAEESNRWRTTWWTVVYKDTMAHSPIFGLGFGYDLTAKFIREYYADRGGEQMARNPHNIVFTFLGRTGLLGATLFVFFIILFFRNVFDVARAVRRRVRSPADLELWLIVLVILIVSLFSHTLEGPMASIPFWSFLGIAAAEEIRFRNSSKQKVMAMPTKEQAGDALVSAGRSLRPSI
jgi:O-antigen ligase